MEKKMSYCSSEYPQAGCDLLHVMDVKLNTCPMAELVTASDCYPIPGSSSEGREFEPHWGSSFL
jgi:hypothetical protein